MSFVRPEATAALRRWREVIAGAALAVLALWWLAQAAGVLRYLAPVLLVAAGALIYAGWQRGRFRSGDGGPGAVEVVEGRIAYFGPLTGGAVALSEITRLVLDGTQHPAVWRLEQPGQTPLLIPVNARGSEALFDAFAHLPGLRIEAMLTLLQSAPRAVHTVWARKGHDLAQLTPQGRA